MQYSKKKIVPLLIKNANELILVVILLFLYIIFSHSTEYFNTWQTQKYVLIQCAKIGLPALAMTFVIISGEIDISVGPMVAFLSVIFAFLLRFEYNFFLAFSCIALLGACFGAFVGMLRTYFLVPTFVGTLSLWLALRGSAIYMTNASSITIPDNKMLIFFDISILSIPVSVLMLLFGLLLFYFISLKTVYGRSLYAIGGNPRAALLSGIHVHKVRIMIFISSGIMAAITALIFTAESEVGSSTTANGLEFNVIASVVIGGSALSGGRGSILGSMLGVIVISIINTGLVQIGVNSNLQKVMSAIIILIAVLTNNLIMRKKE